MKMFRNKSGLRSVFKKYLILLAEIEKDQIVSNYVDFVISRFLLIIWTSFHIGMLSGSIKPTMHRGDTQPTQSRRYDRSEVSDRRETPDGWGAADRLPRQRLLWESPYRLLDDNRNECSSTPVSLA